MLPPSGQGDRGQWGPAACQVNKPQKQPLQDPQNQNSTVECEKGPDAEPASVTEQNPQTPHAVLITRAAGNTCPPVQGKSLFFYLYFRAGQALPECSSGQGVHWGIRSNGILLHLRANSRNDSAPSPLPGAARHRGPQWLSYLCGRCMRMLVGQCLSYLHGVWAPLTFLSTMYKQCQSQVCPRLLHTCYHSHEGRWQWRSW